MRVRWCGHMSQTCAVGAVTCHTMCALVAAPAAAAPSRAGFVAAPAGPSPQPRAFEPRRAPVASALASAGHGATSAGHGASAGPVCGHAAAGSTKRPAAGDCACARRGARGCPSPHRHRTVTVTAVPRAVCVH